MDRNELPEVLVNYIKNSNMLDINQYLSSFSDMAMIEEHPIGNNLYGKEEIKSYFQDYFINYHTHTEILEYKVKESYVETHVLFKGSFPGNEIGGLYEFFIEDNKIVRLVADLEK